MTTKESNEHSLVEGINVNFRPMESDDLPKVVSLIESHDEDDAEEAEHDYQHRGLDDQWVFIVNQVIVGVTGYRKVPNCDETYWLSWTYVHDDECGKGYGRAMLQQLLDKLRQFNARKIFVKVSDYVDPEDGPVYEAAMHLYHALGFEVEVTLPDFYDDGESQRILGLLLRDNVEAVKINDEKEKIEFNAVYEIGDSDGAYSFGWDTGAKWHFNQEDIAIGIDAVKEREGRAIFLTFPSNLPSVVKPLTKAGFVQLGMLKDYYETGVHEFHFGYHLTRSK